MYTPKTTSLSILVFGLIFWGAWLLFVLASYPALPFQTSFTKWEILTYSQSPQVKFSYQGQEYAPISSSSMSCNHRPCNQVWEKITLIFSTKDPNKFIPLWDLVFVSLFPLLWGIMIVGWIIFYIRSRKRRADILLLKSAGSYTDATILDIEIKKSNSKNWVSRIIGYIYICRDKDSWEEYRSDMIDCSIFEVGNSVKVIRDKINNPWLYWVDLNTVSVDVVSQWIAQEYHENKNIAIQEEIRHYLNKTPSFINSLFALFFTWGLWWAFSYLAWLSWSFIAWIFAIFFVWLVFYGIHKLIHKKRFENLRQKNISEIATIVWVEKAWSLKILPLGYIPDNEKESIEIEDINDGENQESKNMYGYKYKFLINIWSILKETEVFTTQFPQKYYEGAKIRVYFDDLTHNGIFLTDIDSVDKLN